MDAPIVSFLPAAMNFKGIPGERYICCMKNCQNQFIMDEEGTKKYCSETCLDSATKIINQHITRLLEKNDVCQREECRKPFIKKGSQVYCSKECSKIVHRTKARLYERHKREERQRMLKEAKLLQQREIDNQVVVTCEFCKKEFRRSKVSLESKLYCSKECAEANEKLKRELEETKNEIKPEIEVATLTKNRPSSSEKTNQSPTTTPAAQTTESIDNSRKDGISSETGTNQPAEIEEEKKNQASNADVTTTNN